MLYLSKLPSWSKKVLSLSIAHHSTGPLTPESCSICDGSSSRVIHPCVTPKDIWFLEENVDSVYGLLLCKNGS